MSELEPVDKQLSLAWRALSPPSDLQAKVRARLAAGGGASAAEALAGTRPASRWGALRASGSLGAALGAALLGAGVALGYLIPRPPEPEARAAPPVPSAPLLPDVSPASVRPPDVSRADAPPADVRPPDVSPRRASVSAASREVQSPSPAVPSAEGASSARSAPNVATPARASKRANAGRRASGPSDGATSTPASDAGEELSLLERAERAVRARHPALALALIRELEQRYSESPLHEERRAIELMAQCQAHGADNVARRESFLSRYPESVYSARIAAECESESKSALSSPTNGDGSDIDGTEGENDVQDDSH